MVTNQWVILDAMGVIYPDGDDVDALLLPFVRELGSQVSDETIRAAYLACSLGQMETDAFWTRVGLGGVAGLDTAYTSRHQLSDGLGEFLAFAQKRYSLACLSNDVSRWSRLLRQRFGLESSIERWFISGEMGVRKPDQEIYNRLLAELVVEPAACLFVDDREDSLLYPRSIGMRTVLFGGDSRTAFSDLRQRLIGGGGDR